MRIQKQWRPLLGAALMAVVSLAQAQSCEGGAYLNPQFFRGEASHFNALADQEMRAFITRAGLPTAPFQAIKHINDVTSSNRTPYCWIYSNVIVGAMSGYKPVAINTQPVRPAVVVITSPVAGAKQNAPAVPLKSLPEAEQKALLERLQRSKCLATAGGVESAIVRAEGLCGMLEDVAPQAMLGQQGLIARAAFGWDEASWMGVATRESSAQGLSTQGLVVRSDKVRSARLVVVPAKGTGVGFGLYVHPSLPEATVSTAVAAFKQLASPSKALAIALDLDPTFSFTTPTAAQMAEYAAAVGIRK